MIKVSDLFTVSYGVNLEFYKMTPDENGVPFVSRQEKNNGVVGRVQRLPEVPPNEAGTISVATGGSVMASFLQEEPYYSGFHVFCLKPKRFLTRQQLLAYCMLLRANRYKYNYGRQANKTLADILLPEPEKLPKEWLNARFPVFPKADSALPRLGEQKLQVEKWKSFRYDEIFTICKGYYNKKPQHTQQGDIPFVGATDKNNGVTEYYALYDIEQCHKDGSKTPDDLSHKLFKGNCITVSNNGSVGYAFYQKWDFTCSHDVNPLYLKDRELNPFVAMFLITLIERERFRWCYGRKWRPRRMPDSIIRLPVTKEGKPDWDYMENFIKSLPYSQNLMKN